MIRLLLAALLFLMLVLGASIGYFNAQSVSFNYLFGQTDIPLIALIIGVFSFAVLLTLALAGLRILRLHTEIRGLKRQLRDADAELKNLRNLPLKDA